MVETDGCKHNLTSDSFLFGRVVMVLVSGLHPHALKACLYVILALKETLKNKLLTLKLCSGWVSWQMSGVFKNQILQETRQGLKIDNGLRALAGWRLLRLRMRLYLDF